MEDASLWATRLHGEHCAGDADFQRWLAADPRHRAAYEAVTATLEDRALTEALASFAPPERPATARRHYPIRWPLAAAGALAAGLALALFFVGRPLIEDSLAGAERITTAHGETRSVALADGSHVTLNGDSLIEVRLGRRSRLVTLERGEAFFDVVHEENRAFEIMAGPRARITVIGTAFDVDMTRETVELSVYRGKVRFAPPRGETVAVEAGRRIALRDDGTETLGDFDPAVDDWRQGWLDTDGITLERLVERLNRTAPWPITLGDERLAARKVAGRLKLDDPMALLSGLGRLQGFAVEKHPDGVVLTPAT